MNAIYIPNMKAMYNEKTKLRYLSHYEIDTAKTYMYDLARIKDSEEFYGKDIFNFTFAQLDDTFRSLQARSFGSINRMASTIGQYIEWAVNSGLVANKIDVADYFTSENLMNYVSKNAITGSICTREEMYSFCDALINAIDRAPIVCAFEGIKGQDLTEMINLRYNDINRKTGEVRLTAVFTDTIKLPDGKKEIKKTVRNRTITIPQESIDILIESYEQDVYYKKNGNAISRVQTSSIIPSDYIIKKTKNQNPDGHSAGEGDGEEVTAGYIQAKITRIFKNQVSKNGLVTDEAFITTAPYMNLNNLFKSGVFSMLAEMEEKKEVLSKEDYVDVCIRYGMREERWASYKSAYLKYKQLA
jgi:integrase